MPRHLQFGLIVFIMFLLGGTAYYFNLQKRIGDLLRSQPESAHPYITENPAYSPTAPVKKVRLFFPSTTKEGLLEVEEREIHTSDTPSIEAKEIVAELIKGSREGREAAIPSLTKLREVYVTGEGLAYVDLTREVVEGHPGGLTREISTIYAIVNSLTENVPSIREAQVLVDGAEVETLAGHVDLSRPYGRDLSMTSLAENPQLSGLK
jgi:hypothetical protein